MDHIKMIDVEIAVNGPSFFQEYWGLVSWDCSEHYEFPFL
jgi:hypothetical protein